MSLEDQLAVEADGGGTSAIGGGSGEEGVTGGSGGTTVAGRDVADASAPVEPASAEPAATSVEPVSAEPAWTSVETASVAVGLASVLPGSVEAVVVSSGVVSAVSATSARKLGAGVPHFGQNPASAGSVAPQLEQSAKVPLPENEVTVAEMLAEPAGGG